MNLLRNLAGETVIYGMSHIFPRVLHFVVFTVYLTYKFPDTKDFGIYNDLYAYATIILVILIYRMDTAFFRFGSREETKADSYSSAYIPLIFTTAIIVLLGISLADPVSRLLAYPDKPYYVIWFALILGLDALVALPYARLRLENKPYKFLFYRLSNVILTLLFVLFFLEVCPRLTDSGVAWIDMINNRQSKIDFVFLANLLASASVLLLMLPEITRLKWKIDWPLWRRMFLYSLPLVVVGIAGSINQAFAVPLQKYFLGDSFSENLTAAGEYAAPAKLALLLNLFVVAFNYAAEPFFFSHAQRNDAKKMYGSVGLLFTIFGLLALLGIVMYMDLAQYIIGPEYREAMFIVPILLYAYFLLGLYYNFSIWYKLADKTIYGAAISIGGALITLALSIYFLPKIGYVASAWAALACYGFMTVLGYVTGRYHYVIDYPVGKMMMYFLVSLVLVAISLFFKESISNNASLLLNTGLLLSFLLLVWKMDGELIRSLRKR